MHEWARAREGYTFPVNDYPVTLALWLWHVNGTPTPISGDAGKIDTTTERN